MLGIDECEKLNLKDEAQEKRQETNQATPLPRSIHIRNVHTQTLSFIVVVTFVLEVRSSLSNLIMQW